MYNSIIKSSQWIQCCSVWTGRWKDIIMLISALHMVSQKCLKIQSGMSYLWNISCSCDRLILSARCGSTFSFSFSSNCCVVSRQYSAVVRILTRIKVLNSYNYVLHGTVHTKLSVFEQGKQHYYANNCN